MSQLTEEQRQEMKEAFALFDQNGDGHISQAEISEVLRAMGQNPTQAEIKAMVAEVDTDENGMVEFSEFEALLSKTRLKSQEEEREEIMEAFRVFDQNKDGFITTEELRLTMNSIGETLTDEEIDNMIREADVNGDGKVDYNEFAKTLSGGL